MERLATCSWQTASMKGREIPAQMPPSLPPSSLKEVNAYQTPEMLILASSDNYHLLIKKGHFIFKHRYAAFFFFLIKWKTNAHHRLDIRQSGKQ